MAWTATLDSVTNLPTGGTRLVITYSDGVKTFTEDRRVEGGPAPDWIQRYAKRRLQEIEAAETWQSGLTPGPIDTVIPDPPGPTPEEIAFTIWARKYNRLLGWQRAIDAGVVTGTEPRYTDLKADVLATKPVNYFEAF